MLRRVLYARLGSADEVDDVLQEVALALVKQQPKVSDPAKAPSYLYQMAVRQSLMYRRTVGRRRNLEKRFAASLPEDAERDPLDWLLADERRERIRRAMSEMTEDDREILLLKHGEHMSYRDIAETLSITESAVEARLYRARKRLRSRLIALQVDQPQP